MDDSNDMEESEACCYKDNGDDIDPDITYSYIDEKIQRVLGRFQKDFVIRVSADNFGEKIYDYGSFLPMYKRPPSIWPHTIIQQRDSDAARLPNSLPSKHFVQKSKAPPPGRPVTMNCNAVSSLNTREPSGRKDSRLPPTEFTNNYPQKDETLSSSGNLMKNRSLKVRIKVGTDSTVQKNAALYSGLGLDDSPISSSENSTDVSEGMLAEFEGSMDASPTKIIQVMTSFQVPGGALISPLHDSLLWLSRKKKPFAEIKSLLPLEDHEELFPKLVNETTALQNKGKLVKEKKKKVGHREKQVTLKNGVTCLDKQKTILMDGKSKNEAFGGNDFLDSELKCKPFYNMIHDFGDLKPSCSASDGSLHSKEDRVNGRFRESYLVSISGQDRLKSNKLETKDEKALKQKAENSGNYVLNNRRDDRKYKGVKASTSSAHTSKVVNHNDYLDQQSNKLFPRATLHEKDKDTRSSKTEQPGIIVKNRVERLQNIGGKESRSFEEGFKIGSGALEARKNTDCESPECERKRHRLVLYKNKKVREKNKDFSNSTRLDQKSRNSKDITMRASGDLQMVKDLNDSGIEKIKIRNKPKLNGGKVNIHLKTGASVKDGQGACSIVVDDNPASKVESAEVALEDDWVCCDNCQKWRLLPFGRKPEQLPEKWLCSMLDWLPGMNRCDISEDETTEKVNALYQLPFSESAHSLQNHANGPKSVDTSAGNQHLDQNQGLETTSNQEKNKDSLKVIKNSGCSVGQFHVKSSLKNHQQESRNSASVNGLSHRTSNQLRNSTGSVPELHNLVEGKKRPKLKENFIDSGNCKQLKRKNKRPEENNLYRGAVKKSKAEGMCFADNHSDFDVDFGKLDYSSNLGLSNMEGGENILEYDEIGLSKHDKCNTKNKIRVSVKMPGKQNQISCGDRSFDNLVHGKSDSGTKKRKLKDWQDDEQNCPNNAVHGRMNEKEICEGFKKEKKSHVSKTKGQDSSESNGVYGPKRRGRNTQISMSGTGNDFVNGSEEFRTFGEERKLQMKTKKIFSEQILAGKELLKRNLDSRQGSITANSSSSKVSLSHSTKTNFDEEGSPAESVSSSPLRTSSLDQFGGDKEEITSYIHSVSHKISPVFGDRNVALNSSRKTTPSCDVQCRFRTTDASIVKQIGEGNNDLADGMGPSCKNKLKEVSPSDEFFTENEDLLLNSNERDRSVLSIMDLDKAKASDGFSEHSKKSMIYEPEVDSFHVASFPNGMANVSKSILMKCSTKLTRREKIHVSGEGLEIPQNIKNHDAVDQRFVASSKLNRRVILRDKQCRDFEAKSGVETVEVRDGKSKCSLSSGGECKQEKIPFADEPLQVSQRAGDHHQLSVNAPKSNGLSKSKTPKNLGNAGKMNGIDHEFLTPDQQGFRDFNASCHDRMRFSSQTACNNTLKKAKDLRDTADRLKNSGFVFESNEAYFQSALKFLHGAFLLETHNASGKHGDKTQMQFYGITAELCEICASEYVRRREMAAAALAYKCIEVAYLRVIYYKHSSTSGNWDGMYSSLRTIVQGESPSSCVSEVDNLNNQSTTDKAIFDRGVGSLVAGSHIFNAGNRTNFAQLLDFTRDMNLAMEASKKSQDAFMAASVSVREDHNRDCVASVKKVIDFSFQDVEELIRLVRLAMEGITRSGFGNARD